VLMWSIPCPSTSTTGAARTGRPPQVMCMYMKQAVSVVYRRPSGVHMWLAACVWDCACRSQAVGSGTCWLSEGTTHLVRQQYA
jgi:hypothetical protein